MKPALLMVISLLSLQAGPLYAQVEGPFGLPQRFQRIRFPQVRVSDCSLPLAAGRQNPRPVMSYRIGEVTAQVSNHLRFEGRDTAGAPWAFQVEIKSGGCWLWRADLDRNGKEDMIILTSDATSAGDSVATLIMIDEQGRPVPWQAVGHYDSDDNGLNNLVDLDRDGQAELLFLHVEGIDRGVARATSLSRYDIRGAHLRCVKGKIAGEMFPIIHPKDAILREEPNLTNDIDANTSSAVIASLIPGGKKDCGVQVPLTRSAEGFLKVDRTIAEALSYSCYDTLTLSDGRKLRLPEVAILDRARGREIAILDTARLLIEAMMRGSVIRVVGQTCATGCRPFLLWGSEPPP